MTAKLGAEEPPAHYGSIIWVGAGLVVAGIVANLWLHPKITRLNGLDVGAVGAALSAWGLILAIVGFGITWWQLQRSRTAAQRVATAVSEMRRDYAAFDVITELRTARAAAEKIQQDITLLNWLEASVGYRAIRVSLMKMASSKGILSEVEVAECKDHVAAVMASASLLQLATPGAEEGAPVSEMLEQMNSIDNFLIALEQSLKGSFRADR